MGTGLDLVYPAAHRDLAHQISAHGLLLSEFPLGTRAMPHHFPRRNRIVAALAKGVLVVEAAKQSGSLITARLAADQVAEGSTVYLDAGTTSLELARELALREDLMIVTNDFMVCAYLIEHGRCRLYHTGGQVIRENQSCAGEATAHFLRNLHLDVAFLSASSWDGQGISTPSEQKVPVKRAVVESAASRILICDSSKYGKVGTFNVVGWDAIDQVITDEQLPQSAREALAQHGVRVTMAPLVSLASGVE